MSNTENFTIDMMNFDGKVYVSRDQLVAYIRKSVLSSNFGDSTVTQVLAALADIIESDFRV